MMNLRKEIEAYVRTKEHRWSSTSISSARCILYSVANNFFDVSLCYTSLSKKHLTKYSIKTYFLYAGRFESEVFGTHRFYDFIKSNNHIFRNCYKEKTRSIKAEDFKRFITIAKHNNMHNFITLLGNGGLRWNEALKARWDDIRDDLLWVVGKGDKQRKVPFYKSWLIPSEGAGSLIVASNTSFRRRFNALFAPYTPHDFRAYYATQVANNPKLGIKNAAMLLGHSSINTTTRYVRADIERCKEVLLSSHNVPNKMD